MSSKRYYLNDASTKYEKTGEFNMSDMLYQENIESRKQVIQLENKIKKIVKAPDNAKVIFTSGATESIATCIHWASVINPYGTIIGSPADHVALKENCNLYGIPYKQIDLNNINNESLPDTTSAIFFTQVDSLKGEIMNVGQISKIVNNEYTYLRKDFNNDNAFYEINRKLLQNKPLLFLDATQSLMRVPIDMEKWGLNAVFWSNHKLGGNIARGALVISPTYDYPFIPLIAGTQNHNMRGGSISADLILEDAEIYDKYDNPEARKKAWTAAYNYLTHNGVKLYKPKEPHLYSTLLIDTDDKCPYAVLSELAKNNIYVSTKSACSVEKKLTSKQNDIMFTDIEQAINKDDKINNLFEADQFDFIKNLKGGRKVENKNNKNTIRISFSDANQIDQEVLDKIINTLHDPNLINQSEIY